MKRPKIFIALACIGSLIAASCAPQAEVWDPAKQAAEQEKSGRKNAPVVPVDGIDN